MSNKMIDTDKIAGLVYGLALGDAWGAPTEFKKYPELSRNINKYSALPSLLKITDDTQMSIYGLDAAYDLLERYTPERLEEVVTDKALQNKVRMAFADNFVGFANDPLNTRAPGVACMTSLWTYEQARVDGTVSTGLEGIVASTADSKGCGTIMRAPWLAVLPVSDRALATIAILQSQTTHGHGTASIAAAWMALVVRTMLTADSVGEAEMAMISSNPAGVLGSLVSDGLVDPDLLREFSSKFVSAAYTGTGAYIRSGYADPCRYFGQGWVADEAFFCAALGAYVERDDIRSAMTHLVISNGDSDSLGAMGGALLGACYGFKKMVESIGEDFTTKFENYYQPELEQAVEDMTAWSRGEFINYSSAA